MTGSGRRADHGDGGDAGVAKNGRSVKKFVEFLDSCPIVPVMGQENSPLLKWRVACMRDARPGYALCVCGIPHRQEGGKS